MSDDNFVSPYQRPGRNLDGTFAPGNPAVGAGRKPAEYEDKLTTLKKVCAEIFAERLTPEIWGAIVSVQLKKALQGNDRALEWISRWVVPPQGGVMARLTPGGIIIEPVDNWRQGLAALAPPDDDDDDQNTES